MRQALCLYWSVYTIWKYKFLANGADFKQRVRHFKSPVHHLKGWVHHFKSPVHHLKGWVRHFKSPVHHFKGWVHHFKSSVHHLKGWVRHFKSPVHHLKGWVRHFKSPVHHLKGWVRHFKSPVHHLKGWFRHFKSPVHIFKLGLHEVVSGIIAPKISPPLRRVQAQPLYRVVYEMRTCPDFSGDSVSDSLLTVTTQAVWRTLSSCICKGDELKWILHLHGISTQLRWSFEL
jgi:hypothetical protein